MLKECEHFAAESNVTFSTDPDANKSKMIFRCGKQTSLPKPPGARTYLVQQVLAPGSEILPFFEECSKPRGVNSRTARCQGHRISHREELGPSDWAEWSGPLDCKLRQSKTGAHGQRNYSCSGDWRVAVWVAGEASGASSTSSLLWCIWKRNTLTELINSLCVNWMTKLFIFNMCSKLLKNE